MLPFVVLSVTLYHIYIRYVVPRWMVLVSVFSRSMFYDGVTNRVSLSICTNDQCHAALNVAI